LGGIKPGSILNILLYGALIILAIRVASSSKHNACQDFLQPYNILLPYGKKFAST